MFNNKLLLNYDNPYGIQFVKPIEASNESHTKIHDFMINFDKLYKKKYKNTNIDEYFKILKDKKNKTKFAYAIRLNDKIDIPGVIQLYYNLKYINSKYDIICFLLDEDIYDSDYLNNKYLKHPKINDKYIEIIIKLFDVVISSVPNKVLFDINYNIKYPEMIFKPIVKYYTTYYSYQDYIYNKYEKIIFFENNVAINKNIDFLFDKYDKSVCSTDYNHIKGKNLLLFGITLIVPQNYYFFKIKYLLDNYAEIFQKYFLIGERANQILYYIIFPNWNKAYFDINIINYNYIRIPNIDMDLNKKYFTDYYIDYFFIYYPYMFNGYCFKRSNFTLNNFNFKNWDLNVKRIILENPEYENIFKYIKSYRDTLF